MRGARASGCKNHLHQLHVCLPAGPGRTRLLYRMSMDFLEWTRWVPGIRAFWAAIAQQVGSLLSNGHKHPQEYISDQIVTQMRALGVLAVRHHLARDEAGVLHGSYTGMSIAWIPCEWALWLRNSNCDCAAAAPDQVMGEDLVLVAGQQERMLQGADVWGHPVAYDKLGVRYRRWRNSVASADPQVLLLAVPRILMPGLSAACRCQALLLHAPLDQQ